MRKRQGGFFLQTTIKAPETAHPARFPRAQHTPGRVRWIPQSPALLQ